jgi:hypothetical protein
MNFAIGKHFEIGCGCQLLFGGSFCRTDTWCCFTLNIGPLWFQWHKDSLLDRVIEEMREMQAAQKL